MGFSDFGTALLPATSWDTPNPIPAHEQLRNRVIQHRTSILPQVLDRSKQRHHNVSSPTAQSSSDSPPDTSSPNDTAVTVAAKRSRKGHRKSRNGCLTCKKRRIKCPENHPSCDQCIKAGFTCDYPKPVVKPVSTTSVSLAPRVGPSIQSTPFIFSLEDMQLFHCYLTTSYPHLPVRGDRIWTLSLPAYAHRHDYLMHAMLALGASHLFETTSNRDFMQSALDHRIKSIHSLNAALRTKPQSVDEWDARYGTLVALSIQAAGMADGIVDFFTTLRGCMMEEKPFDTSSVFHEWVMQRQTLFGVSSDLLEGPDGYSGDAEDLIAEATEAILALEPLCMGKYEHLIWESHLKAVTNIMISPLSTYVAITKSYTILCTCPTDVYAQLFDPSNHASWLLVSYGMSLHALLRLCGAFKFFDGGPAPMRRTKRIWTKRIYNQLPDHLKSYGEWPLKIAQRTEHDVDDRCWKRITCDMVDGTGRGAGEKRLLGLGFESARMQILNNGDWTRNQATECSA